MKKHFSNITTLVGMAVLALVVSFSFNYFSPESALTEISTKSADMLKHDAILKEDINADREESYAIIDDKLAHEKSKLHNRKKSDSEKHFYNTPLPDGYLSKFLFEEDLHNQSAKTVSRLQLVKTVLSKETAKNCGGCHRDNFTRSYGNNRKTQYRQKVPKGLA